MVKVGGPRAVRTGRYERISNSRESGGKPLQASHRDARRHEGLAACGGGIKMMAERGVNIDYSTIHRWVVHFSLLQERASTPASVLLAASGIWMRLTSEFEVGGCISTVQSTALVRQSTSGSANIVIFQRLNAISVRRWSITGNRTALASTVAHQLSGNHLMRCREPSERSLMSAFKADPHPPEPVSQQSD